MKDELRFQLSARQEALFAPVSFPINLVNPV